MEMTNLDVSSDSLAEGPAGSFSDALDSTEQSPTRSGPPSETSSQEWDKVTDPGSATPNT